MEVRSKELAHFFRHAKPYLAVILLQFGSAGNAIISKFALNKGMSQHVFVVYRYSIAAALIAPFAIIFERKVRPRMTLSIFIKIALLGLLEPAIDQNLYYTAMKLTTATFASAMCNVLPVFAFFMAWVTRLEKVNLKKVRSQAKVLGTFVTVGGAMVMTLVNGPMLNLPWTKGGEHRSISGGAETKQEPIKGALMITAGCFCWSGFITLQAITLKSYPAELSLTGLICLMGALEAAVVGIALEWKNPSAWLIQFDYHLLAPLYSAIVSSGVAYYIQGVIMQVKGPVFVTSFQPLSMVIVAIISSCFLAEVLSLGRVLGAVVIVLGLYLFLWGKSKDPPPNSDDKNEIKMGQMNHNITNTDDESIAEEVEACKMSRQDDSV